MEALGASPLLPAPPLTVLAAMAVTGQGYYGGGRALLGLVVAAGQPARDGRCLVATGRLWAVAWLLVKMEAGLGVRNW